jgi:hypothetical protein
MMGRRRLPQVALIPYISYSIALQVLLIIAGIWWVRDVFGRFESDLDVVKNSRDRSHKGVIIFWWGATGVVVLLLLVMGSNLAGRVIAGIRILSE